MAVTKAETGPNTSSKPATETRLDSDVSMPSNVVPGEAPYDTTDPNERATSVSPDKASAALAGYGTVNAVVKLPEPEKVAEPDQEPRVEQYQVVGPDGKLVTVEHDINKGTTKRV